MITRDRVEAMLTHFRSTYGGEITAKRVNAFYQVLRVYSEKQVFDAGFKYLGQGKKFPVPADIVERITPEDTDQHEEGMGTCSKCGEWKLCLGGQCQQCYTGLTPAQISIRFKKIHDAIDSKGINQEINHEAEAEQKEKLQEQKKMLGEW